VISYSWRVSLGAIVLSDGGYLVDVDPPINPPMREPTFKLSCLFFFEFFLVICPFFLFEFPISSVL